MSFTFCNFVTFQRQLRFSGGVFYSSDRVVDCFSNKENIEMEID